MTNIILSYREYFKHLIKNDKKCLDTACGKVVICLQVIDIRFYLKVGAKFYPQRKCLKDLSTFPQNELLICGREAKM